MEVLDLKPLLDSRTAAVLAVDQRHNFERIDRLFVALMLLQWLGAFIAVLWISSRASSGTQSYTQIWTAFYQGAVITLLPLTLGFAAPGRVITRHVIAAEQMLMSGLLIALTGGGRSAAPFHIFGALVFCLFIAIGAYW